MSPNDKDGVTFNLNSFCVEKLASMPEVCVLVQHILELHAPSLVGDRSTPVTLHRASFEMLCLAALAGLDAAECLRDAIRELQNRKPPATDNASGTHKHPMPMKEGPPHPDMN